MYSDPERSGICTERNCFLILFRLFKPVCLPVILRFSLRLSLFQHWDDTVSLHAQRAYQCWNGDFWRTSVLSGRAGPYNIHQYNKVTLTWDMWVMDKSKWLRGISARDVTTLEGNITIRVANSGQGRNDRKWEACLQQPHVIGAFIMTPSLPPLAFVDMFKDQCARPFHSPQLLPAVKTMTRDPNILTSRHPCARIFHVISDCEQASLWTFLSIILQTDPDPSCLLS